MILDHNDKDNSVISKKDGRVRRKHRRKIVDKGREEIWIKNGTLRNSRVGKSREE